MNSNARVWKNTDVNGNVSSGIYETFYNDAGEVCGIGKTTFSLVAEDTAQLKLLLASAWESVTKPLLNGDGFVFASCGSIEAASVE